jgi:integrase
MHLTDISVRNLRPPQRGQITYSDDYLTGFGVRVSQGGTKTFTLVYGQERRRSTIGRVGVISLSEARQEAKRLLAQHTLGRLRPSAVRFDAALAEFFAELEAKIEAGENKPRTLRDYRRLLNRYFNFGRKLLPEITHEEIMRKLPKAPGEKSHALVAIKVFFAWAHKPPRRYVETNPLSGVAVHTSTPRTRVLSDAELKKIWAVCSDPTAQLPEHFKTIVKLLILTGQRRSEVAALRREWISDEGGELTCHI